MLKSDNEVYLMEEAPIEDGCEPTTDQAPYDEQGDVIKFSKAYSNRIDMKADEPRTVIARISTTAVDRDGDVVLPSGLQVQEYRKNPVVLLNHDNGSLPIGKALSVKRDKDSVVAKVQFAERPAEHPVTAEWVPDTILSLFKQKVLRAFSVGFMPLDMREANDKDRKKFGEQVRRVITDWNLLEFSVVPVPANQDALAIQVAKSSNFLTEAWCLPTAKQMLVVPRRTLQLGDSAKTQDVRPLYRGPADSKNVRLPLTLKEGE